LKFKKEFLTGLMIMFSGILAYWGINFLKGMNVFSHEDIYFAQYDDVDGLMTTNPVLISGLKVGQIKDVYFVEDKPSDVIVEIMITKDIKIPSNSLAKIISSDLMGSKALVIIPSTSSEYAISGDTLMSEREISFQDAINRELEPIKKRAEKLMSDVDTLLAVVHGAIKGKSGNNIAESLERILNTIKYLEETSGAVSEIVVQEQTRFSIIMKNLESITTNFDKNQENLNHIIQNFTSISDTIAKANIAETIASTQKTISDFDKILQQINSGEGSLGLLLKNDSLYYELMSSSKNLDLLLEDIRKNPKRYINVSVF
jgi:phospholipid/cholesterol/gamma-HCH transport system substrate-binding protein